MDCEGLTALMASRSGIDALLWGSSVVSHRETPEDKQALGESQKRRRLRVRKLLKYLGQPLGVVGADGKHIQSQQVGQQ